MRRIVVALALVVAGSIPACADVALLKDGKRLEGEITDKGEGYEIKTDLGTVTVAKADVAKIVKVLSIQIKDADELHKKARVLYEEATKPDANEKESNAKLKEAVELLRKVLQMFSDAREAYPDEKHGFLDETPIVIIQEMRLYRDKMHSEIASDQSKEKPKSTNEPIPLPFQPDPVAKPDPKEDRPPEKKKTDVAALQAKAKAGDPESQFALGTYFEIEGQNVPEALKWYQSAAGKSHLRAQVQVGVLYLEGNGGIKQDYAEAAKWFEKAASSGCGLAFFRLGMMHFDGSGYTKNIEKADELCAKGERQIREDAKKGDPDALIALGRMYIEGLGVPVKHPEMGLLCHRKAVAVGSPRAEDALGGLYATGRGVEKDLSEAVKWLERAAAAGWARAQARLGRVYDNFAPPARNPILDFKKASEWYGKAATQNDAWAEVDLGTLYMRGTGVPKNPSEGVKLYQTALNTAGSKVRKLALNNLGFAYLYGQGVKQDQKEALKYFHKAAEMGDSTAQFNLGFIAAEAKNEKEAVLWYTKAAQQGYYRAQTSLGICYMNGAGITKNLDEAFMWLVSASQQGDAHARDALKQLDEVRNKPSKNQ